MGIIQVGPMYNHKDLYMREVWVRVRDVVFQDALKMEEGAMSQGIQAPLEVRKGENIIYPKHSKDMLPCQHLDFSPVKSISDFWPPEF